MTVADMQLMDAGLNFAHRMRGELQRGEVDGRARFTLPVWVDETGHVRIALPVESPEHGTDVLQLIVPLDELLTVVGHALGEDRMRRQIVAALDEDQGPTSPDDGEPAAIAENQQDGR